MSAIYELAGSLWSKMRADYEAELDRQFMAADEACSGYLVSREGQAKGITGRSLFVGPAQRAWYYATCELHYWWNENGRLTLDDFEREWLESRFGSFE